MVGGPRAEAGYAGMETGDAQVGVGSRAVANSGTRVAEELGYRYIIISNRV